MNGQQKGREKSCFHGWFSQHQYFLDISKYSCKIEFRVTSTNMNRFSISSFEFNQVWYWVHFQNSLIEKKYLLLEYFLTKNFFSKDCTKQMSWTSPTVQNIFLPSFKGLSAAKAKMPFFVNKMAPRDFTPKNF